MKGSENGGNRETIRRLASHVEDADLGVGNTTAVARLWVRLVPMSR